MAQLSAVTVTESDRETVATIVGAGTPQRFDRLEARWADVSLPATLREVYPGHCSAVEDLSPVANGPMPIVWGCSRLLALPAMRNAALEVAWCNALTDISGLAGGRVGHLKLRRLDSVEDVSAVGAMRPPSHMAIVEKMHKVHDVSTLAGIHQLQVIWCHYSTKPRRWQPARRRRSGGATTNEPTPPARSDHLFPTSTRPTLGALEHRRCAATVSLARHTPPAHSGWRVRE